MLQLYLYQGLEREFLAYEIMNSVGVGIHHVLAHAQGIRSVDE
jgi:hypothetical protein